ncbi:MAG: RNA 2',3'-cyclic phosphodiesterase, partial [Verrucomicrobiae bacterium]|nr:RNA 2',3'-cyclic phosphodiesterase [Verrucomicrobiae bacterium]
MNPDESTRLFVAIPIPEFARKRLAALNKELPHLRWVSLDNIHLTLKFIGEVEEDTAELIRKQLSIIRVKTFLLA